MDIEFLSKNVKKIESVFLNILYLKPEERVIAPDMNVLGDLKNAINSIFEDNKCINVIYTLNTDKPFFGIKINPNMSPADATIILSSDERVKLNKYQIEFDSKLFEVGLSDTELAALTIYEISSMMDNFELFDNIRALIDTNIVTNDDVVNIRDSVNYAQLIIFALKDTMYKLSSFIFKDDKDELTANSMIQTCGLSDDIISARNKVINSLSGTGGESFRSPKPIILEWMFVMYKNMRINSCIIADTLKDAKAFTASKLEIKEIDKTLESIDHIDNSIIFESYTPLNKFFDARHQSIVNELSIFKNLKKNGLRGIENELYEFSMKVKNCTESEDAYMIMRGINSRLGILEDYLLNEDLTEYDRKHWEYIAQQYRDLRVRLSQKKFKEKQYGLFFDYSKLDKLDNPVNENLAVEMGKKAAIATAAAVGTVIGKRIGKSVDKRIDKLSDKINDSKKEKSEDNNKKEEDKKDSKSE